MHSLEVDECVLYIDETLYDGLQNEYPKHISKIKRIFKKDKKLCKIPGRHTSGMHLESDLGVF